MAYILNIKKKNTHSSTDLNLFSTPYSTHQYSFQLTYLSRLRGLTHLNYTGMYSANYGHTLN